MTGRQEYDRTKDRQRTVDEYMIDYLNEGGSSTLSGCNKENLPYTALQQSRWKNILMNVRLSPYMK
jgi:hypothetical protein